jgi:response regulator of citrate/malate metabolism
MEVSKSLTHYEKYKDTIRNYQRSNQKKINEYYRNKRYENARERYLEKEIRYLESKKA